MNNLTKLPTDLTHSRGLTLLLTENKARSEITKLMAALILRGPLFVIAASEWLPTYKLTRMVRRSTRNIQETFDRLYTVRASTCFRLLDSIGSIALNGEPILVLDFLYTFYDANLDLRVRLQKLVECCRQLKLLAFYRPVMVMTQEMHGDDYEKFLPALSSIADKTFTLESKPEPLRQLTLF